MAYRKRKMENLVMKDKLNFKGKKVFLTGHTGFKGAWMLKTLLLLGADVKGYSLEPKHSDDLFNLIENKESFESIIADIRDYKKLEAEIINFQPDIVFHLAAQPLVRESYEAPLYTYEVNTIGTGNLLNAIRFLNNPCNVIVITTDKVYHNNEWEYPYRENDRLGGFDPYSASKACAEILTDSYRNSFFNITNYQVHQKAIAVCRAGNVIGGGDWSKDRLLPDVARALGNGYEIGVRNPTSVRPWQHVLEPICGYLLLASRMMENPLEYSKAYNFGPNSSDALSVEEMVILAVNSWGKGKYNFLQENGKLHEAGLLKLDISLSIKELSWKPKLSAKDAVEYTIKWYKEFYNSPHTIDDFTSMQIDEYISI